MLLKSVEEVTGKKKKKITHYHTIGFIGLSSEGLFSIVFPNIKGDSADLIRLSSGESTFTARGGDGDFNHFEEVIKKYSHENRGIEGERYIKFLGFSDTQKGKVPVITLKRNEKLSIDPDLLNFSLQENPYYPYIISKNTQEGVQAFKEALDAFTKKVQELKNVHGSLLELFESHFLTQSKNREG